MCWRLALRGARAMGGGGDNCKRCCDQDVFHRDPPLSVVTVRSEQATRSSPAFQIKFESGPAPSKLRPRGERRAVDSLAGFDYLRALNRTTKATVMKVRSSLKSLKARHKDCRVVRRKGRVYVINKTQRRFKARQG